MSGYVRVELVDGKAMVIDEEVHPGEMALREAVDELIDERPCYCSLCRKHVISEEKRCPECHSLLWGQATMPEGWSP